MGTSNQDHRRPVKGSRHPKEDRKRATKVAMDNLRDRLVTGGAVRGSELGKDQVAVVPLIVRTKEAVWNAREIIGVFLGLLIVTVLVGIWSNQNSQSDRWSEWTKQRSRSIPQMLVSDSVGLANDSVVVAKVDSCLRMLIELKELTK